MSEWIGERRIYHGPRSKLPHRLLQVKISALISECPHNGSNVECFCFCPSLGARHVTVWCTARISTLKKMDCFSVKTITGGSSGSAVRNAPRLCQDRSWLQATIAFILNVSVVKSVALWLETAIRMHWLNALNSTVVHVTSVKFHRVRSIIRFTIPSRCQRPLPSSKNRPTRFVSWKFHGEAKTKTRFDYPSMMTHRVAPQVEREDVEAWGFQSECQVVVACLVVLTLRSRKFPIY